MLDQIGAALTSLSPAEQSVGRLVLADPAIFSSLPVSELAGQARVSAPRCFVFVAVCAMTA